MANNECCDPQPIRGGGGGGGGPIVLNGDVTGLSNANIAEQSSRATFPINAVLAGPLATLVLRGGTGDAGLSTNGTDLSLSPGVAGGNADVGSFATVRLRNASQLQAESTVAGTYRALIYLDGTNTIQLGDAAVPLNVRGSAGTCAVPFVWSAKETFTATPTAIQLGPTAGDGTARVIRGSNGSSAVGTGLSFVTGNGSAGLAGGAFVFTAGGPVSGNVSGSGYSFTASNASGTSTNAGGGFAVTTGNGSGEAGGFGNGGAFSVTTGTGYNGGAITLTVGDSRYAGGVGGTGGAFTATAGRGGFSPGGAMTLLSGPGGAADASSSGTTSGAASLKSNTGGAGSATRAAGASGTVTVQSGDAGANAGGGGAASGNVVVDTGAATGAATNGTLSLGATNANAVTIGRSGKVVTINSSLTMGGAAAASALVTLISTTQGAISAPVMTTVQKNAIGSPAKGLTVFDGTTNRPNFYDGTAWREVAIAPSNNGVNLATDQTTNSATYTDLATVTSAAVTVGASGVLKIWWGSSCYEPAVGDSILASVALSGANTLAASDANCAYSASPGAGLGTCVGRPLYLTGLTPGVTTVTLQWRTLGATWHITNRTLMVEAPG